MRAWIDVMFECDAGLLSDEQCSAQTPGSICVSVGSVVEGAIEHFAIHENRKPAAKHKTSMVVQPAGIKVFQGWKVKMIEDSAVIVCRAHAPLLDNYGVDASQGCDTVDSGKE